MKHFWFAVFLSFSAAFSSVAQNAQEQNLKLSGTITNNEGVPLPYATVYIRETGTGAVANDVGHFQIYLKPGTYHLVFQYMGFQSVEKTAKIVDTDVFIDVSLEGQIMLLKNIVVSEKEEDPAYAVMRKAIAKAKYHKNQIDTFSAKVYIKGKGRLLKAPFLLRRRLKKEGIDSTKIFLSETYSQLQYKRPDTYSEKVVSVRATGPQEATPPMEFITGNVYDPLIGDVISPLSPKAFAYYRFEYLGTFKDKDYEITKIKIIPRVLDEYVVAGVINIVEDYFSVHSLDIKLIKSGINIDIEQIYTPVLENVWMPVTHKFFIHGKFMGFRFEYTYLAAVSDYYIEINPDLPREFTVVDEKTEIIEEEQKPENRPADNEIAAIEDKMKEGEEVTTGELKKVLKTYEKEQSREMGEPFLVFNKQFSVDSMAYERDSAFWTQIRPIPLNKEEVEGYQWLDSLAEVNKNREMGDTLTSRDRDKFSPLHLITGARYKVGGKAYIGIDLIGAGFNTVEGWNLETSPWFTKTFDNMQWLRLKPVFRYGFSSKDFYSYLDAEYSFGPRLRRNSFRVKGGKYISQLNSRAPIIPIVNTVTSLFFEENHMKLYEKQFVEIDYAKNLRGDLKFELGAEWARRTQLFNSSGYTFIDDDDKFYEPNAPENIERANTAFEDHEALIFSTSVQYRPGLKFGARNGQIFEMMGNRAPVFRVNYQAGLEGIAGEAAFHHLSVSGEKRFRILRNSVDARIEAGAFLGRSPNYFIDYQHFTGNKTLFAPGKGIGKYRLLDYYLYSTSREYLSAFAQYNPSKLLLSHFRDIRLSGFKEYLFANFLYTPALESYVETGVGFDNIFRIFKVEAVAAFVDGQYQDFGIRLGLASFIRFDGNSVSFEF